MMTCHKQCREELEAEVERLEATVYDLAAALAWAVRDGRAHGVSVCICVRCEDARATFADYEQAEHNDGQADG